MKDLTGPALRFLGKFLLLFGLLTALTYAPSVGGFLNLAYRKTAEPLLKSALPKAYLQMKAEGPVSETLRIEFASKEKVAQQLAEAKRAGRAAADIKGDNNLVNFHNLFLSFFLFYVSLVTLSPIGWRAKLGATLLGGLLYWGYSVLKLYLVELIFFNEPHIGIYQTGAFALNLAKGLRYCMTLGANVLVVLLLWAGLVLRKGNWAQLLSGR